MSELRWILLGLGVLFWIGLWWWETRRQHQASESNLGRIPDRLVEPILSEPPVARRAQLQPEPAAISLPDLVPLDEPVPAPAEPGAGPVLTEAFARIEPVLGDTEIVAP